MNLSATKQLSHILLAWLCLLLTFPAQAHLTDDSRPIKEVLDDLSKRHEVFFSYNTQILKGLEVEFIYKEGESLDQSLNRLFKGTHLAYESHGEKYYVLYRTNKEGKRDARRLRRNIHRIQKLENRGNLQLIPPSESSFQQVDRAVKIASTLRLVPLTGTVKDEEGKPLNGASIRVKGQTIGALSDENGRFSLDIPAGPQVLLISYIGYLSQEINVNGQANIDVAMIVDEQSLDEVVVVGYGTVRKSDLTGSVASVKAEALDRQPITTLDQGLQGLAAGVQVQQTSGAPGGAITLRIRGNNSISAGNEPLYVIDGLPIVPNNGAAAASPTITGFGGNSQPGQPTSPLATIAPNDIESIEVLKDASATAIYGARASNGVVLITTKRGKSGRPSVSWNSYIGTQQLSRTVDFMDADQHRAYLTDAINAGASTLSVQDLPDGNTDWLSLVQQENPIIQSHTLGVSGGTDAVQYSVSGNFFQQQGLLRNSGIERSNLRMNIDAQPNKRLKVGVSANTSLTGNQVQIQNGTGNYQTTNSPFTWAQWLSPLQTVNDAEGNLAQDYFTGDPVSNPEALVSDNVVNNFRTFRTLGTVFAEYEILKGLKYKLNFGADISSSKRNSFFPETHPYGRFVGGLGAVSNTLLTNWLVENLISYNIETSNHRLGLLGGITSQKERVESSVFQATEFEIDNLSFNSLQQGSIFNGVTGVNIWTLQSFFAQANYVFKDKYLLTANIRADGSSKFGANNRWGYFPSMAAAWQVHKEAFFEPLTTVFSNFKLRASYGVVGNQEIPANLAFAAITNTNEANLSNDPESEGVNALLLASLANPDLKWETTSQLNVGLDLGFLNGRITATANFYRKVTDDLLLVTPLPPTSGFSSALQNVGQVSNTGFELAVTSTNIQTDLLWTTTLNFSTNRNEVLALNADQDRTFITFGPLQSIDAIFALEVGQPLGVFYGYQFEGIYQTEDTDIPDGFAPGDPRYADISGPDGVPDGAITADDRTIIGDPNPDLVFGISNTFEYKGFDLTVFFNGEIGKDMINWNRTFWETGLINFQRSTAAADAWSPTNPSNEIPRLGFTSTISSQGTEAMSSRLVEDGTFLRLRNLTLGYTLPIESKAIRSMRFYGTAQNLLTITNYSGFDPEANYRAGSATIQGLDFGSYPLPRTFLLGVQANF